MIQFVYSHLIQAKMDSSLSQHFVQCDMEE